MSNFKTLDYNIDLARNILLNPRINPLTASQRLALSMSTGDVGYTVWDTTDNLLYVWTGTAWINNSTGIGVDNVTIQITAGLLNVMDGGITFNKIRSISNNTLLGRVSAGSGVVEMVSIVTNLSSPSATTIPTSTAVTNYAVPLSRTLTINSVTYDLSTDRSWTIATVTSLAALTDVSLSSLANHDLLRYQTSDSKWHNWAPDFFEQGGNTFGVSAIFGTFDNHDLGFYTNSIEYMRLLSTGNLMVGSPGSGSVIGGPVTFQVRGSLAFITGNQGLNKVLVSDANGIADWQTIAATTITLTGDVTGSGTSSIATSIGALKVTNAMLAGSITATKLVGTDIATVGTITSGIWNGTKVSEIYGGTNQSTYTLGDILYASATNTLSKLSGNTTSTKKFLTQTGTGTTSAAPSWGTLVAGDIPSLSATYFAQNLNAFGADGKLGVSDTNALGLWTNNLQRVKIFSGGNFAIGSTTDNGNKFQVSGDISGTGYLYVINSNNNVGLGFNPYNTSSPSGTFNVAIGYQALLATSSAIGNIGIGRGAGNGFTTGGKNIAIGHTAGQGASTSAANNVIIGDNAVTDNSGLGNANVIIGSNASNFSAAAVGSNNVAIGQGAGGKGSSCVMLGNNAGKQETADNKLYIANSNTTTPLLLGDFSAATLVNNGTFSTKHLIGIATSAPTIAAGAGAGTSPTVTVTGTDLAGYISITTGTLPTLSAIIATITFNLAYTVAPRCVVLTPANANTATLSGVSMVFVDQAGITTTTFAITAGATALTAATTYQWYYNVTQ